MYYLHQFALYLHIVIGTVALILFWIPAIAKKGSKTHIVSGKYYTWSMYVIAVSGLLMCVLAYLDPVAIRRPPADASPERIARIIEYSRLMATFLFMLSLLVLVSIKHSILVLKVKSDRAQLKHWTHSSLIYALGIVGLNVTIQGATEEQSLLIIFGILSLISSMGTIHYIHKSKLRQREWMIEHLSNMIGSGIGVYTAFFAVGGRHLMAELLPGQLQLIPWIAPGIIGTLLIFKLKTKYEQKYKVQH